MQIKNSYYFIDFDSTFIQGEGIEALAAISLEKNPEKNEILRKIAAITVKAMEGEIPFEASLTDRLTLLKADTTHIKRTALLLKKQITKSIKRNAEFFTSHKDNIYIISGGFKEFIIPVVASFGIAEDHIFANTFVFDKMGRVIGVDKNNPMSQDQGKVKVVNSLNLEGDKYIIGDGYTDYQLKELGLVNEFIAFTENIERKVIVAKADTIAPSFDEFLYVNNLPMSVSYPKSRIKVMLLENIDNDAVTLFEKEGYSVHYYTKSLSEEELREKMKPVYILGVRSRTQLTKNVLENANRLLAIGSFGIDTNHIDLEYAASKGIAIFNAPYSSTRSVTELLKKSGIIKVYIDGRPGNKNLTDDKIFHLMKRGVVFLNASHGFIVAFDVLSRALRSGKVKGAADDLFPKEAQKNIAKFVSEKVIDYINTGNTHLSVNLPEIQLPKQGKAHRLLHLHKNVPGILAQINRDLANHNINIVGQYLKTNEKVGYVITDVDKKYDKEVLNVLKQIPDTIRFRVLY